MYYVKNRISFEIRIYRVAVRVRESLYTFVPLKVAKRVLADLTSFVGNAEISYHGRCAVYGDEDARTSVFSYASSGDAST